MCHFDLDDNDGLVRDEGKASLRGGWVEPPTYLPATTPSKSSRTATLQTSPPECDMWDMS